MRDEATKTETRRRDDRNQPPRRVVPRLVAFGLLAFALCACGGKDDGRGNRSAGRIPGDLREIPPYDASALGAEVDSVLQGRVATIDSLRAAPASDPAELGAAFGEAGMDFHAYDLFEQAEACYRNARELVPDEFRWSYYLGQVLAATGDASGAIEMLEDALALRPGDLPTLTTLGRLHVEQLQLKEGERLLHKVLVADPSSAASCFYLGQAAMANNHPATAVDYFNRALALQPEATKVHVSIADAYRALGDQERAERQLALRGDGAVQVHDEWMLALRKRAGGFQPAMAAGMAAFQSGDLASAAAGFRKAVDADPENASAWVDLGTALYKLGEKQSAEDAFEKALRLDPDLPQAHRNLGAILAVEGRDEEAIAHYRRALEISPDHVATHLRLAELLRSSRRFREALASYRSALDLDPSNRDAHLGMAFCLIGERRFGEARNELQESVTAFPEDHEIANDLARLLAACPEDSVRDGPRAVKIAGALVDAERKLPHLETLAMASAEVGDYERAVKVQRGLVRAADRADRADLLPRLRANLQLYEAGRPCRKPWPDL